MRITRTTAQAFTVAFETEEELREEHRVNLSFNALRLPCEEPVALDTTLLLTLQGPWGGEAYAKAKVVASLPGGLALAIDGDPSAMLERLLAKPAECHPERGRGIPVAASEGDPSTSLGMTPAASAWDRMRSLSQMEKLLLAVKADRSERALLLQDSDPRVLLSLLRNPRLTIDEVIRIAKSSYLTFQIADVILKTQQWLGNLDVRVGLIHNPKTPPAFAMRILPTLPESEVRVIARSGTNMALKQAALRMLQGKA